MDWLLVMWVNTIYNNHYVMERFSTKTECVKVGTISGSIGGAKPIIGESKPFKFKCIKVKK